mgnify:CR=1 FL=1
MDKIVEIARFTYPADAQPLMALLRSEGIECYLRNELSSQIMAGYVCLLYTSPSPRDS